MSLCLTTLSVVWSGWCAPALFPLAAGAECFQWGNVAVSPGRHLVVREAGSDREMSSSLVIPAMRQGWRSSELQAALHFALPTHESPNLQLLHFSFLWLQARSEDVGVPRSVEGMGRGPGSCQGVPCREQGSRKEDLLLSC